MTPAEVREYLAEENPDAVLFDGLDAALIGVGGQYTKRPLAIYSVQKIIEALTAQSDDGDEDAAVEWFDFNIACLWAGDGTPILVYDQR